MKAAETVRHDGIAIPILLGKKSWVTKVAEENIIYIEGITIIDI